MNDEPGCIRNERATREASDKELPVPLPWNHNAKAWCGRTINAGWGETCFLDADHVLFSLAYEGGHAACVLCLREMRRIIDEELGEGAP